MRRKISLKLIGMMLPAAMALSFGRGCVAHISTRRPSGAVSEARPASAASGASRQEAKRERANGPCVMPPEHHQRNIIFEAAYLLSADTDWPENRHYHRRVMDVDDDDDDDEKPRPSIIKAEEHNQFICRYALRGG